MNQGTMAAHFPLLPLSLRPENAGLFTVLDAAGQPVGRLKQIGRVWKFKAIGYTDAGQLVPGGGPLTHGHNTVLDSPDVAVLQERLICALALHLQAGAKRPRK
jgi:hypothetical protein